MIPTTPNQAQALHAHQENLAQKEDRRTFWYGLIGDGLGTVDDLARPGWILVRLPELKNMVVSALNTRVQAVEDMPVVVGYAPENPQTLQVLSLNLGAAILAGGNTGNLPAMSIPSHHTSHEWFGNDMVSIWTRQLSSLRPTVGNALEVNLARGVVHTDNGWVEVPATVVDLDPIFTSANLGADEGLFVLIYIDRNGDVQTSVGKPRALTILSFRDIPLPPFGGFAICGIRVYRDTLYENETTTDIVDLRLSQPNPYNILMRALDKLGESLMRIISAHILNG